MFISFQKAARLESLCNKIHKHAKHHAVDQNRRHTGLARHPDGRAGIALGRSGAVHEARLVAEVAIRRLAIENVLLAITAAAILLGQRGQREEHTGAQHTKKHREEQHVLSSEHGQAKRRELRQPDQQHGKHDGVHKDREGRGVARVPKLDGLLARGLRRCALAKCSGALRSIIVCAGRSRIANLQTREVGITEHRDGHQKTRA